MMNFCTSYGANYIHKGLVLYESLRKVESDFMMYVMAFDKETFDFLRKLSLPNLVVDNFEEIETDELKEIKKSRNRSEYCWTVGPFLTEFFIMHYNLESIAFIDADMMFYTSPKAIFDEIGSSSVAITRHDMEKIPDQGKYIVQFEYFKNDENGMKCLRWWGERCKEWCYYRYEDGKFGDQKYLESFEKLFDNVYVLKNPAACVSIVNMNTLKPSGNSMEYKGVAYPIVLFPFMNLKFEIRDENTLVIADAGDRLSKEWLVYYGDYCRMMIDVYNRYLGKNLSDYKINNWSHLQVFTHWFKGLFRLNPVAQWFYYKVLNVKMAKREENQI